MARITLVLCFCSSFHPQTHIVARLRTTRYNRFQHWILSFYLAHSGCIRRGRSLHTSMVSHHTIVDPDRHSLIMKSRMDRLLSPFVSACLLHHQPACSPDRTLTTEDHSSVALPFCILNIRRGSRICLSDLGWIFHHFGFLLLTIWDLHLW